MELYETVFMTRQDISPSQVESLADAFKDIIAGQGGQVDKTEYCGLRHLAYPIKKNRKAHYVLMNITASSIAIHEMERNMRLNEDIMRYLTIRVKEHQQGPSALLQQSRSMRDSYRGRQGDYDPDLGKSKEYLADENEMGIEMIQDGE